MFKCCLKRPSWEMTPAASRVECFAGFLAQAEKGAGRVPVATETVRRFIIWKFQADRSLCRRVLSKGGNFGRDGGANWQRNCDWRNSVSGAPVLREMWTEAIISLFLSPGR